MFLIYQNKLTVNGYNTIEMKAITNWSINIEYISLDVYFKRNRWILYIAGFEVYQEIDID